MNCPVCNVELRIADRQGVEIDYCPKCRGVWLDRGELDKLIERAAGVEQQYAQGGQAGQNMPPARPATPPGMQPGMPQNPAYRYDDDDRYEYKRKNDYDYDDDDDDRRRAYPPGQYPQGQYPPGQYPQGQPYPRKKKSFLGEVFDIFD